MDEVRLNLQLYGEHLILAILNQIFSNFFITQTSNCSNIMLLPTFSIPIYKQPSNDRRSCVCLYHSTLLSLVRVR